MIPGGGEIYMPLMDTSSYTISCRPLKIQDNINNKPEDSAEKSDSETSRTKENGSALPKKEKLIRR